MTIQTFVWGFMCVVGISVGQILFKLSSEKLVFGGFFQFIGGVLQNYYLIAGLFIYVLTTFLWISLLKIVDLKDAYPIMALAFIIVPVLSMIFLDEDIALNNIIGAGIIIIGIIINFR